MNHADPREPTGRSPHDSIDVAAVRMATDLRAIEWHGRLPSTNDAALQRCEARDLALPMLIGADEQTAGRGRAAHRWWSAEGALTFSLIIDAARLGLDPPSWPRIALAAGVAVCRAVRPLVPEKDLGLKWPNDVLLEGRKLAGILVEGVLHTRRVVIGIGINVNNSMADAPDDIRRLATSLRDAGGTCVSRTQVLIAVLRELNLALEWLSHRDARLAAQWNHWSALRGCQVCVHTGQQHVEGRCIGIDDEGSLVLETQDGQRRLQTGTVTHFHRIAGAGSSGR